MEILDAEQIDFSTHSPELYSSFPDVDDAIEYEPRTDGELFRQLADVILSQNVEREFGICLLHQHFQIEKNEVVFEEVCSKTNTQSTNCVLAEAADHRATSWCVKNRVWHPMTFGAHGLETSEVHKYQKLFERIGSLLEYYAVSNRFGLCVNNGLVSRLFSVHLESTDSNNRRQRLEPIWSLGLRRRNTIETSWFFEKPTLLRSLYNTGKRCKTRCKTSCLKSSSDGPHGPWHSGKEHTGEAF